MQPQIIHNLDIELRRTVEHEGIKYEARELFVNGADAAKSQYNIFATVPKGVVGLVAV